MRDTTTLYVLYVFGGFIIGLLWASTIGEVLLGTSRGLTIGGIVVLAVAGLAHPLGAIATLDLVRLDRTAAPPGRRLPPPALAASVAWLVVCVGTALALAVGGAS